MSDKYHEALVAERTRLRVAAERCAEPEARLALEEIARDEDDGTARGRRAAT